MDVDPEVAALLNDLPPVKLPPALTNEGWGQLSMRRAIDIGTGHRAYRSQEQQPTYTEHCVQCGHPITRWRKGNMWADHAGRRECENVLLDKPVSALHITEREREFFETLPPPLTKPPKRAQKAPPKRDARWNAKCSATKYGPHVHKCPHPEGHFGFHECIECRHLWR